MSAESSAGETAGMAGLATRPTGIAVERAVMRATPTVMSADALPGTHSTLRRRWTKGTL